MEDYHYVRFVAKWATLLIRSYVIVLTFFYVRNCAHVMKGVYLNSKIFFRKYGFNVYRSPNGITR